MSHVAGYCVALDMTARDFQSEAKSKGLPWELAKSFDTSCPVGKFMDADEIADPHNLAIWCKVNGSLRQSGHTGDMIFTIPSLISYISKYFTLEPGDLLLTGTPQGVAAVQVGDVIEGGLSGIAGSEIKFTVAEDK
jgi:acylpyruvate hydrolase